MRIVFFGTPDFAVESLRAIVDAGYEVVAVVTATDKVAGRGHKMQSPAVKVFAQERGLKVLQPEKLKNPDFIATLRDLKADLFVVIAFRMLPEVVWSMPPLGTFNLHASLLPKYRGAAPINHAVMNGETRTGVTTFFLRQEIDTGDIIDREEIEIHPDENVGSVHDRLMALGAQLTLKTLRSISDGTLTTTPQNELIEAGIETCPAPKIFKDTCCIEWNTSAKQVHDKVRGLSPYPGAWAELRSSTSAPTEIKIFRTAITDLPANSKPGTVVLDKKEMLVCCADKMLRIEEIQPAGKKRMATDAFLRGAHLSGNIEFKVTDN